MAHNVTIGEQCVIAAQTGISGSAQIGNNVMMGGQVGVAGHLRVGDGVKAAARAGISKTIKPGEVVSGAPAMPLKKEQILKALTRRLPELFSQVDALERRLKALEGGDCIPLP